jgi:hypothetical protein
VFNVVPMLSTEATMTIEIPAAIKAYSMAVAPVSSPRKALSFANMRRLSLIGLKHRFSRSVRENVEKRSPGPEGLEPAPGAQGGRSRDRPGLRIIAPHCRVADDFGSSFAIGCARLRLVGAAGSARK